MLLSQNMITEDQLEEALSVQKKKPFLRLGELLFSLGHLTFSQLEELLEQQYSDMRLGQLLIRKGYLTADQLENAMNEHERTGLLLGHLIIKLGYCSMEQLQQVLEEQRRFNEKHAAG
jgi:hypothetical protein